MQLKASLAGAFAGALVLTILFSSVGAASSGAQLAYIGKFRGLPALYVAANDGSGRRLVAQRVEDHTTFSWSPDGARIAFSRLRDRKHQQGIYIVNGKGGGLEKLAIGPTVLDESFDPSWSPDGKLIAFDGSRSYRSGQVFPILVIRADGTGERMLTRPQTLDEFPTWSPDGASILFEHPLGRWGSDGTFHGNGRIDLVTMNHDGSGRRKIAQVRNEPDHCACPAWSPDGTKIAYEAAGPSGKPDIYAMNADGSGELQLTTHPSRDENPDWSPDGMQIAFYSERTGNGQIFLMNADGTEQHRITRDPWYDQAVRWRPGG